MLYIEKWLYAWVDMICGLIGVLSFGFIRPWWDLSFRAYLTLRRLKAELKELDIK